MLALRACLAQSTRSIAHSSTPRPATSLFHTSSLHSAENSRKARARTTRKQNIASKQDRLRQASANRPHVVLGTRPGDERKWLECDLARVLVQEDRLAEGSGVNKSVTHPSGEVKVSEYLAFGVGENEKKALLETLPALSAEGHALRIKASTSTVDSRYWLEGRYKEAEVNEIGKANALARLLDLRNANAGGIAYENRKRIVEAFSGSDNSFDTGRPEVQAALLTYKIRKLWTHLTKFKRDVGNRLSLRKLVHQRAKVLKYLKRVDRDRYDAVLERLALEPQSVEGELVV